MSQSAQLLKRVIDLCLIGLFCPLILLLTVVIAVALRLTSGPPVIFRQQRAGRGMIPFTIYKFRTMKTEVDPFGPSPKAGDDPRLTALGKALRASSLDELPQFWNVVKGQMSLVGPRPLYMEQARDWNDRQRRRLEVKPGLTGLAQISGRGGLTIEDKLELDVTYVENQSLGLDLRIVLATVFRLWRPRDIYEKRYSRQEDTRGGPASDTREGRSE